MEDRIAFTLSDILQYFNAKRGKVVYSEIVTHFKHALSDPATQAEARNLFKDHVNTLATVSNENGTKYLVLRPKYMQRLIQEVNQAAFNPTTIPNQNGHENTYPLSRIQEVTSNDTTAINYAASAATSDSAESNIAQTNVDLSVNNARDCISSHDNNVAVLSTDSTSVDTPPRPPPRKKNSFSRGKSSNFSSPNGMANGNSSNKENENNLNGIAPQNGMETNQEVKKEIQELARTPGRVKEHAQILNKLASVSDFKLPLPMPTSVNNSIHSQVVNKIRNGYHGNDSDSGSVQIADSLKKKWILAASNCDYNEMCCMLKEDPNLSFYCDFIAGYNALHWAAKFNNSNIIKLIAGKYSVSPNIKSFSGSTPLHLAYQFKHEDIITLLVNIYDANKEIRDNYGKKPEHYVESKQAANNGTLENGSKSCQDNANGNSSSNGNSTASSSSTITTTMSATENLRNNLRNKISHQSMLVRNKFRQSKAFQSKRKSSFSQK